MSQFHAAVDRCVNSVLSEYDSSTQGACIDRRRLQRAFEEFSKRMWCESVDLKGSAVLTSSCLQLWELLAFLTSNFGLQSNADRAVVLQLLSALYPKFSDRRCLFQQMNCSGFDSTTVVPLSSRLPHETELTDGGGKIEGKFGDIVRFVRDTFTVERTLAAMEPGSAAKVVSSHIRQLRECILPACVIDVVPASKSDDLIVKEAGDLTGEFSWRTFCHTLWKLLALAELHSPDSGRELSKYLVSSGWSSKTVDFRGKHCSYSELLSSLVEAIMVSASVHPKIPTSDNCPPIPPQVFGEALKNVTTGELNTSKGAMMKAFNRRSIASKSTTLPQQKQMALPFKLSVPPIEACEELVLLCRDLLHSPISAPPRSCGLHYAKPIDLLFSRKRERDSEEGPSLIPRNALNEFLESDERDTHLLVRLSASWGL